MKKIILLAICFTHFIAVAQSKMAFSIPPCAGSELWQVLEQRGQDVYWEEVLLCDLDPNDHNTWSWFYNYKGNKKGLIRLNTISYQKDDKGKFKSVIVELPINKYKYKLQPQGKDLLMTLIEGDMSKPYDKYYKKIH